VAVADRKRVLAKLPGGLALVLAGALIAARAQDPEPPIHTRIDLPSVAACGGCHVDVTHEWTTSLHAGAWTNANVRTATNDFRKKSCRPCHSPHSVFETGLDRAPAYRDFNQADGVHCLSCHGLADGVAARRTIADAPCKPRYEPRFLTAELCFPCHEPTHGAFAEYRESDAYELGVRCVDCHMPVVDREGERAGVDHGPNGGLNAEFVRRALGWEVSREEGAVVVTLSNRTGHRFPGEIPSRAFLLEVTEDSGEPWTLLLRKPGKKEEREDDRLRPDEVRRVRVPVGGGEVRVRLIFQPLPLLPREQCFVIGEWRG